MLYSFLKYKPPRISSSPSSICRSSRFVGKFFIRWLGSKVRNSGSSFRRECTTTWCKVLSSDMLRNIAVLVLWLSVTILVTRNPASSTALMTLSVILRSCSYLRHLVKKYPTGMTYAVEKPRRTNQRSLFATWGVAAAEFVSQLVSTSPKILSICLSYTTRCWLDISSIIREQ